MLLGIGGILGGMLIEKGELRHLYQVSAAVIVFGGTIGAVMITTPMAVLARAAKHLGLVFFDRTQSVGATIDEIIEYATQARKQGIVSLEQQADNVQDPFLQKGAQSGRRRHRNEPDPLHHGTRTDASWNTTAKPKPKC